MRIAELKRIEADCKRRLEELGQGALTPRPQIPNVRPDAPALPPKPIRD
ncbi:hypothetical protein FTUN_4249 [Frigoriglobus tundricola]|uniref:Uncharacterized protein n=1 Tax=Frigoriglobus tundricola TaxID=2774151 RepID=A0A6M5YTI2_9BACT|nr:hypothetical protein FTUN_4249 [Frigoriglobus tundricola]